MSSGGRTELRCNAGGVSARQRGVFLPLGPVPVHVPGEFTALKAPSLLSHAPVKVFSLSSVTSVSHFRWARFFSTFNGE